MYSVYMYTCTYVHVHVHAHVLVPDVYNVHVYVDVYLNSLLCWCVGVPSDPPECDCEVSSVPSLHQSLRGLHRLTPLEM